MAGQPAHRWEAPRRSLCSPPLTLHAHFANLALGWACAAIRSAAVVALRLFLFFDRRIGRGDAILWSADAPLKVFRVRRFWVEGAARGGLVPYREIIETWVASSH